MSDEVDKLLSSEERQTLCDKEINRILECHESDFFAIIGINPLEQPDFNSQLKKLFRKKSLLIHPDKANNKDAPNAFDLLNKANSVLSGTDDDAKAKRQKLIDIYNHVKSKPNVIEEVRQILDEEIRQDQQELKQKQEQETRENEEYESRKQQLELKKQFAAKWEDLRESRVANWRDFSKKITKKKKKKTKVLA